MRVWQYLAKTAAPPPLLFKGFDKARLRKRKTTIKRADGTITQGYRYFKEGGEAPELGHRKSKTLRDHESRGTTHGRKVKAVLRSGHSVTRQVGDLMHLGYYDAPHLREMTGASKKQVRDAVYYILRKEKERLAKTGGNEAKINRIDKTLKQAATPAPKTPKKPAEAKRKTKESKGVLPWKGWKKNLRYFLKNAPPKLREKYKKIPDKILELGLTGRLSSVLGEKEEGVSYLDGKYRIKEFGEKVKEKYGIDLSSEQLSIIEEVLTAPLGVVGHEEKRDDNEALQYAIDHNRIPNKSIFRGVRLHGGSTDQWEGLIKEMVGKTYVTDHDYSTRERHFILGGALEDQDEYVGSRYMDVTSSEDIVAQYVDPSSISDRQSAALIEIENENGLIAASSNAHYDDFILGGNQQYEVVEVKRMKAKDFVVYGRGEMLRIKVRQLEV